MQGHNVDGICRRYISTGCRNDWCRFLHIMVKTIPSNHKSIDSLDVGLDDTPTSAEAPWGDASEGEEAMKTPRKEGKNWKDDVNDSIGNENGDTDRNSSSSQTEIPEYKVVDELYEFDEMGDQIDEPEPESITETEKEVSEGAENNHTYKVENIDKEDGQMDKSVAVERDLQDFLWLGRKHNVWKEIKATKAEIKKLTRDLRERRKEREDPNQ